MHRVKQWAHISARSDTYGSWTADDSTTLSTHETSAVLTSSTVEDVRNDGEKQQDEPKAPVWKRFSETLIKICLSSWVNMLLVFIPAGIAVHFARINPTIVFAMNAIAIIPLAGLLSFVTESVAHRLGDTWGALLNVSFGNAVELIIFIIALVKNQIRIVQASLVGSILANLLLILGMSFLIGGLRYQEQVYNSTVTQLSASLLCLAVLSLLIPTAFHASFNEQRRADIAVLKVSRGTAVILLLVYVLYLLFQLKSHAYLYESTPQHIVDEESHPGILRRTHSSSSPSVTSLSTGGSTSSKRLKRKNTKGRLSKEQPSKTKSDVDNGEHPLSMPTGIPNQRKGALDVPCHGQASTLIGRSTFPQARPGGPHRLTSLTIRPPPVFRTKTEPLLRKMSSRRASLPDTQHLRSASSPQQGLVVNERVDAGLITDPDAASEPPLSKTASVFLLLGTTALVALCAEFMVGSINELVLKTPLNEAFVGLIILPIVGNAAEHVTAVTVAAKNKMDLAIGVAIGSSIQIAVFITPLVVIIGWILNKDMPLYFTLFETMTLFVATFVVNFLVLDGRSNYLEGSLLCSAYIIIAVATFFFPSVSEQSNTVSGPPERGTVAMNVTEKVLFG